MAKNNSGFTLLEILLVVAAIAILAGIVIVAINPGKQLGATRNAARQSDVSSILNAVFQYSLDNDQLFPPSIDSNLRMLGTSTSGCAVSCGSTNTSSSSTPISQAAPINFIDDSQTTFSGVFSNTKYDTTNNWVNLSSGTSGSYTSNIKDTTSNATWNTLAWTPNRPTGKNLPNNGQTETTYPAGNANMTGNVLLMHLDESDGATTFSDSSGSGNNGVCGTATCPKMIPGKLGNTPNILSNTGRIKINDNNSLDLTNKFTLEFWFYQISTSSWTSYGHIIEKGFPGGYSISGGASYWRIFLGNPIGGGSYAYQDITWLGFNTWIHLAFTFDNGLGTVYINGTLFNTKVFPFTSVITNSLPLNIGSGQYNGYVDEAAVFNRTLSATEIADTYKRGALTMKHQLRTCAVADCSDASFVGPDGTANSYYSEINNTSNVTPSFSLSNLITNRYIQYKTSFDTTAAAVTPELKNLSITGTPTTATGGGTVSTSASSTTADACLDLTTVLVNQYITSMPFDPKIGTIDKTYYAIKKTTGNRINVVACNPENSEIINVTR